MDVTQRCSGNCFPMVPLLNFVSLVKFEDSSLFLIIFDHIRKVNFQLMCSLYVNYFRKK